MRQSKQLLREYFGSALSVVLVLAVAVLISVGAAQAAGEPEATAANEQAKTVNAARQMLARQDYDNALSTLETVLAVQPTNSEARFLKGLALARSGQIEEALKLFDALASDYPDMAEIWNNIGVLRARIGDFSGARKALEKATTINPEHVAAQQNLGDVYVVLARQAYRNVSALTPDNQAVETKIGTLERLMQGGQGVTPVMASVDEAPTPQPTRVASVGVPEITAPTPAAATAAASTAAARRPAVSPEQTRADVRAALRRWAQAWSAQDLDTYFAAYSDDFDPRGARTIQQWRALRVRRVRRPETISIDLSRFDVELTDGDTAVVRFDQAYASNLYQDKERKTVTMKHGAQGWLITNES